MEAPARSVVTPSTVWRGRAHPLGARILHEYVYRAGTIEAGLQYYNGALSDSSAQYASRVMAERERLLEAVQGG